MIQHLVLSLLLGINHFLQSHDLIDEQAVGLRNLSEELLQLLNLLLRGSQLFRNHTDVLTGGEVFGNLWLPRGWCLTSDVVQSILTVSPKVGMFELENLKIELFNPLLPIVASHAQNIHCHQGWTTRCRSTV